LEKNSLKYLQNNFCWVGKCLDNPIFSCHACTNFAKRYTRIQAVVKKLKEGESYLSVVHIVRVYVSAVCINIKFVPSTRANFSSIKLTQFLALGINKFLTRSSNMG